MLLRKTILPPCKSLSEYIEGYHLYAATCNNEEIKSMIPEGIIEIVFHLGSTTTQSNFLGSRDERRQAFIGGIHTHGWEIDVLAPGELLSVRFKPGGLSFFCSTPIHLLKNQMITLEDLWGKDSNSIEQLVIEQKPIQGKIYCIEDFLMKRFNPHKYKNIVGVSNQMLKLSSTPINYFSEMCNYSQARFRHLFNEMVGCSPKEFQTIRRLNHAVMRKQDAVSLTSLSMDLGYFDQSHFIKDCKKITGYAPTAFFRKSLIEYNT